MAMEANWDEVTLTELIAEFGKPLVHWHKCVGCGRRFDCQCENGDYSQPIECMECLQAEVEYYYNGLQPLHRITTKVRKPNIPEWDRCCYYCGGQHHSSDCCGSSQERGKK
jgi:hypothetical protein